LKIYSLHIEMNILANHNTKEMIRLQYSSIKESLKSDTFYIITECSGIYKVISIEKLNVIENGLDGHFKLSVIRDKYDSFTVNRDHPDITNLPITDMYITLEETEYLKTYEKEDYNEDHVNIKIRNHIDELNPENVFSEIPKDYYNISLNGYSPNKRYMLYDYAFLATEKILL
jgi:hypothetical protein